MKANPKNGVFQGASKWQYFSGNGAFGALQTHLSLPMATRLLIFIAIIVVRLLVFKHAVDQGREG